MNWKFVFRLIVFIVVLSSFSAAKAENDTTQTKRTDTPALTLEDCLMIGVEENLGLKNERIDVEQSVIREKIYKTSRYFPDIYMSARIAEVFRPEEDPKLSQSMRAYTSFRIFDMAQGPRRKKYRADVLLNEFYYRTATASLQRNIAVAYIDANLVRKKQEILIAQLLEMDSLMEIASPIDTPSIHLSRLAINIVPLKEVVKSRLKALETNYEDKIGQLNNLMSLASDHTFRLADDLILSDNGIEDEMKYIEKIIKRAEKVRMEDDEIRKQNLMEDMKIVNSAYFPTISAGVAYDEDFMTSFKGFTTNLNFSYNVLDPNAKKKKDIAKLNIEQINNSILENKRDIERQIRGYYNKSKEYRGQVRESLVTAQKELYENTLTAFLQGNSAISPMDVINTLKDFYEAQNNYYQNIAYSEMQKVNIRYLLMDYVTPFDKLGDINY